MSLRQHKLLIYRLKRQFGQSATYYRTYHAHDILTGAITTTSDSYFLKKAVLMPAELQRDFVYDLAYIAAGKNFTHGAYYDMNLRLILIDAKDLPKGFKLEVNDHIEFDDERYEFKVILEQPQRAFYAIMAQALSNAPTVG